MKWRAQCANNRCGKAVSLITAMVLFCMPAPRLLVAQELKQEADSRYRLIQVVDRSTLLEKINEAASDGYRLVAASHAPSASLAAIMKGVGSSSSEHYRYVFAVIKGEQQFNDQAAQGFRLHTLLGSEMKNSWGAPPVQLILEQMPGSLKNCQYAVRLSDKRKISELIGVGYNVVQAKHLGGFAMDLILEKSTCGETGNLRNAPTEPPAQSQGPAVQAHGYKYLGGVWTYGSVPKKELIKAGARGDRLVSVFYYGIEDKALAIVEEAASPGSPYEYRVLEPGKTAIQDTDLDKAGGEGFRVLRQNSLFLPFVMEKAPDSSARFNYRLLTSARLADLSAKMEDAGREGYEVIVVHGFRDAIAVLMEKSQPAGGNRD